LARGMVVFDSLYGNTVRIARALASGLQRQEGEVKCVRCN
jgi:flavodoxin